ncbi:MAG: alpha/beta hydrolase, partial [Mycobacterium sp.]
MSRPATSATILLAATALLAGCVPVLAANPHFATNSGRHKGAVPTTPPPSGPPPVAAPKNDLSWHDCTARSFSDAAVPAAPGVTLDCATYDADLDPANGASGSLSIGAVRARSVQTPPDAGPVVFTTGSDLPS